MPILSEMPCWEIVQCNKKHSCLYAGEGKKQCWEFIEEDHLCSFHICIDCLVYLAKHEQSTFPEEQFHAIMKQRKKKEFHGQFSTPSQRILCPVACPVATQPKSPLTASL